MSSKSCTVGQIHPASNHEVSQVRQMQPMVNKALTATRIPARFFTCMITTQVISAGYQSVAKISPSLEVPRSCK